MANQVDTQPAQPPMSHAAQQKLHTSTGVVEVSGQKYAVGLVWQPLQNLDDPILEIRESAESELGADLYCLRPAATPQYGLGHSELEHHSGMPALAASVAAAFADRSSVCAVFKVAEGYWLVAVRNDLILAEEDIVFATEAEAQRAYAAMMAVPDWDVRIVPAEWNMEGTEQQDLAKIVSSARKVRLQEINAVRRTKMLLFLAVLIIAVVGWLVYSLFALWQKIKPEDTIHVISEPTVIQPKPPEPPKAKPWENLVKIEPFLNQCWTSAYEIKSIVVPGWTMGNIQCTPESVSTTWALTDIKEGRLTWMNFGLAQYQLTNFQVDVAASGTSAEGHMYFKKMPMGASIPKLDADQLAADLKEIQQATGLGFDYSRQTLYDPPTKADGTRPPNQKAYTYYSFVTTSPYPPQEWLKFFNKFAGMELLKVEYNPSVDAGTKWKYEGRIYAK